jgi:hypothetical protein
MELSPPGEVKSLAEDREILAFMKSEILLPCSQ